MEAGRLRPMGVGEVLDAAIKLYVRNFWLLVAIAAAIAVPLAIVIHLLDQVAFAEVQTGDTLGRAEVGEYRQIVDFDTFRAIAIVEVILGLLGYLLTTGAAFHAVGQRFLDRRSSVGESLRFALRRAPSLLWLNIIITFSIGLAIVILALLGVVGILLAIVAGLFLVVIWAVSTPALLVEGERGFGALGRSSDLTKGHRWRVLGALIVGIVFVGLFQFLIGLAADGLTQATEDSLQGSLLIFNATQTLSTIITTPLLAAIITVIYFDLRVRSEGFDVQLLAERLRGSQDTPAPGSPPSPGGSAGPRPARPGELPGSPPASQPPPDRSV